MNVTNSEGKLNCPPSIYWTYIAHVPPLKKETFCHLQNGISATERCSPEYIRHKNIPLENICRQPKAEKRDRILSSVMVSETKCWKVRAVSRGRLEALFYRRAHLWHYLVAIFFALPKSGLKWTMTSTAENNYQWSSQEFILKKELINICISL